VSQAFAVRIDEQDQRSPSYAAKFPTNSASEFQLWCKVAVTAGDPAA
jgi:hypothetical protein